MSLLTQFYNCDSGGGGSTSNPQPGGAVIGYYKSTGNAWTFPSTTTAGTANLSSVGPIAVSGTGIGLYSKYLLTSNIVASTTFNPGTGFQLGVNIFEINGGSFTTLFDPAYIQRVLGSGIIDVFNAGTPYTLINEFSPNLVMKQGINTNGNNVINAATLSNIILSLYNGYTRGFPVSGSFTGGSNPPLSALTAEAQAAAATMVAGGISLTFNP